jgi:hypothetical protein
MPVRLLLALTALLAGCPTDDTVGLIRFNNEADAVTVRVTADTALGDAVTRTLTSNTGATEIGEATVMPGSGPVGTEHEILVLVAPEFRDVVIRANLLATGDRGEQRHALLRDSADPGLWVLDVVSYGDVGEEREDTFAFELWRAADPGEEPDVEEEPDGP